MPYMNHYKMLCNYLVANITLIHSINYAISLGSSFLYSANCYNTVLSSFYKL